MRLGRTGRGLVVLAAALLGLLLIATPVHAATRLSTSLTGAEEVSPTGQIGVGDPDGSGRATIVLIPEAGKICFALVARDIEPAFAAHIHVGPAGANGPVVVTLEAPTRGGAGGCVEAEAGLIDAIATNPTAYYVNVHNTPFPGGALRGQLGDDV